MVVVKMALDSARKAGVDVDLLTAGLSFDARSLRRRRIGRVPWDDYCRIIERTEIALGGPDEFDSAARAYYMSVPPQLRRLFGAMVSAKALYRFVHTTVDPVFFPNLDFGYDELPGDRIRLSWCLRPGSRPCRSLFRGGLATVPYVACHLGLPPAKVDIEELTDRSCVAIVHVLASHTLLARAHRASVPALRDAAMWLIDLYAGEARAESDRLSALLEQRSPASEPDVLQRMRSFERARGLTAKQAEVLALVVRGFTNKEIARELDCAENTVEFHMTQLLRRSGTDSRAQLIAKFWAQ